VSDCATQRLAVESDGLALEVIEQVIEPASKGVLERLRIERLEDAPECVGARRAFGHHQEPLEEVGALRGEDLERLPAIGAADGTEQRHDQDVYERVRARSFDARVRNLVECGDQRVEGGRFWRTWHPTTRSCRRSRV